MSPTAPGVGGVGSQTAAASGPAAETASEPGPSVRRRLAASLAVATVGFVVVVTVLGASSLSPAGAGAALSPPGPDASLSAHLSARDGWPEGQRLTLAHCGGEPLPVADLAVVLVVERTDQRTRLTDFPTRRLDPAHFDGADIVDGTYAGIDGALDAAHTDGRWEAGEQASIRIAQEGVNLRTGDRVAVTLVHRPSDRVVDALTVTAR